MLAYHFEGVPRSPLGIALKNILTLGIHTKVWLYRVNREMDGHEGFHIDLRWLAVMVTLPIITPIVVKFQTARRLNQMVSHQVTLPLVRASRLGWISLVPVLGAGFYAYWVQDSLNRHWFHHRRDERIRLAKDRLAALDERIATTPDPDPALENKRARLQADVREWDEQVAEEIEAARIRWGEERFADRKKRADLHAAQGGRMSRKELAALRAEETRHRKQEKAARKAARGRLFGLLPAKKTTQDDVPDVEDDALWQPKTPLPGRMPEDIRAAAESEDRPLTPEEEKEVKTAEKALARREKEQTELEKRRSRLRARQEKERTKREALEEKARKKAEEAARKAEQKSGPKPDQKGTKKAARKGRKSKKQAPAEPGDAGAIPVDVKPRTVRAPPTVHESGPGPLRLLTVRCPRCRTEIRDVRKRGDEPAKITCPSCHLVGKL